jgi:hypothetical protein
MPEEQVYFQQGEITVTSARFIVSAQTFAMRTITSIREEQEDPTRVWPVIFILAGVSVFIANLMPFNLGAILGLAIFVAGIWQAVRSKPTFSVVLTAAHGEVTAYRSKNREFVSQIIQALNKAIASNR